MTGFIQTYRPHWEKILIYLTVIYIVGITGLSLPASRNLFIFLTPVNIVLCVGLVCLYHPAPTLRFWLAAVLVYAGGFLLEWVGVETGSVFGVYYYEEGLGVRLAGVPPIMGLNWFLLVYTTSLIGRRLSKNPWIIALVGSFLMVGYDWFLEPAAMRFHFWQWQDGVVPLQNYLAWWAGSYLFIRLFCFISPPAGNNRLGEAVFWLQAVFFAVLGLVNNLTN